MKNQVAGCALAGFLVACFWAVFALVTGPVPLISEPVVWALARISCPIVAVGTYFHFGVKLYWVLVSNAAAYGLAGLLAESARRLVLPRVTHHQL